MNMEQKTVLAWLDGNSDDVYHDPKTVQHLVEAFADIAEQVPGTELDDTARREMLRTVAYRLMDERDTDRMCTELAADLARARQLEAVTLAKMKYAAGVMVETPAHNQSSVGRLFGVDRMTVRNWLGL